MFNLEAIQPEHLLSLLIFVIGTGIVAWLSACHAKIFEKAAPEDARETVKQASITFVSGHFLAFFVLPFAIIAGASLAILGKLDSGISAIIGMIISYIVQKVVIR